MLLEAKQEIFIKNFSIELESQLHGITRLFPNTTNNRITFRLQPTITILPELSKQPQSSPNTTTTIIYNTTNNRDPFRTQQTTTIILKTTEILRTKSKLKSICTPPTIAIKLNFFVDYCRPSRKIPLRLKKTPKIFSKKHFPFTLSAVHATIHAFPLNFHLSPKKIRTNFTFRLSPLSIGEWNETEKAFCELSDPMRSDFDHRNEVLISKREFA